MSFWVIVGLIVVGYLLAFIEVFVPGGILGIVGSMLVLIGVIGSAFTYGPSVALPLGLGCAVAGVVFFAIWARYFPSSPMGRKFNLQAAVAKDSGYVAQDSQLEALVGQTGVTVTDLRPAGIAKVGNHRIDVVSLGAFLDKGQEIIVVEVSGNRVVVEPFTGKG